MGPPCKITPCLKLIRKLCYKLETYTHVYVALENIPISTKTLLILLMSAFFCKNSAFFGENGTFTQMLKAIVGCVRDFLVLFAVFER